MAQPSASHSQSQQQEQDGDSELRRFFKAWAWKREHRPDRERFVRPYLHPLVLPDGSTRRLSIRQAKFSAAGFASTVWDSAIVVAKMLEAQPQRVRGKRCLDLSAGCGLVGIVAAQLGATAVVATDLEPNLPLLRANCAAHGHGCIQVSAHIWGEDVAPLQPPFDVVLATDVMYVPDAVPALVATLGRVCASDGVIVLAHGRNRFAEDCFLQASRGSFDIRQLQDDQLHPDYQCSDVVLYELRLKQ